MKALKTEIYKKDCRRKPIRYAHLKCVRTGNGKKRRIKKDQENILKVGLTDIRAAVHRGLRDDAVELVPIVTILSTLDKQRGVKIEDFRYDLSVVAMTGDTHFWCISTPTITDSDAEG